MKIKNVDNYYQKQNSVSSKTYSKVNKSDIISIINDYNLANDINILDVGTRTGKIVKELYYDGYSNIYGIDIGENAKKQWNKYKDEVKNRLCVSDFCEGNQFNFKFDLLIFSHTFEHLHYFNNFNNIIDDYIYNDSLIYIILPFGNAHKDRNNEAHNIFFDNINEIKNYFNNQNFNKFDILDQYKDGPNDILEFIIKKEK